MANELLMLTRDDAATALRIFDAFAERTGLRAERVTGGVRYPLDGSDHGLKIVEILNDIDRDWARHIALGQPYGDDR
jgi:hypothetical protein